MSEYFKTTFISDTEEILHCTKWGCTIENDDFETLDGKILCDDCVHDYTVTCERCGRRIWDSNDYGDDDISLCQSCYEGFYTKCYECDCIIHHDDAQYRNDEAYCQRCYDEHFGEYAEKVIHDYNYKPKPIFYGDGIHYGIELEVDIAGESDYNASCILDLANYYDEHIYVKHDGSLSKGFEIVSHPMSLAYHFEVMDWDAVLKKLVTMGYLSHQTDTCGIHLHIERSALGYSFDKQEETISNILYFVEKNWNELLKFSRRTESQMKRWANRYGYRDSPKAILDHAKNGNFSRYTCVNLQNTNTVEIRMFRGTLKYSTFKATLQMVDSICDVAFRFSADEMKALTWNEFVKRISPLDKSELIEYLKFKDLYVNEPVTSEQEDI